MTFYGISLENRFSALQIEKRASETLLSDTLAGNMRYQKELSTLSENPEKMQQLATADLQAYFLLLAYRVDKDHDPTDKELLTIFYPYYIAALKSTDATVSSSAGSSCKDIAERFLYEYGAFVTTDIERDTATARYKQLVDDKYLILAYAKNPCEEHVNFIASMLFCSTELRFTFLSDSEQHAALLLILRYWQLTGDDSTLDLLLYAMPYCWETLDTVYPGSSIEATVTQYLKNLQIRKNGNQNFFQYLKTLPLNYDLEELKNAVHCWKSNVPSTMLIKEKVMNKYYDLSGGMLDTKCAPFDKKQFTTYFNALNGLKNCAQTIPNLRSSIPILEQSKFCAEIQEQFCQYEELMGHLEEVCKENPTDQLAPFFALAVRSEFCNIEKAEGIIQNLISDEAKPEYALLASRMLFPEIGNNLIQRVLTCICKDLTTLQSYFEQLNTNAKQQNAVPYLLVCISLLQQSEFYEEIAKQFCQYGQLMKCLKREFEKNPTDELASFLSQAKRTANEKPIRKIKRSPGGSLEKTYE